MSVFFALLLLLALRCLLKLARQEEINLILTQLRSSICAYLRAGPPPSGRPTSQPASRPDLCRPGAGGQRCLITIREPLILLAIHSHFAALIYLQTGWLAGARASKNAPPPPI